MKKRAKVRQCVNSRGAARRCTNRSTEGRFVDDMCAPCHEERAQQWALMRVFSERARQDVLHGGSAHDDRHTLDEWNRFLIHQTRRIGALTLLAKVKGRSLLPGALGREEESRLVKIAALALAALESVYRVRGPLTREELVEAYGASQKKVKRRTKARRKSR